MREHLCIAPDLYMCIHSTDRVYYVAYTQTPPKWVQSHNHDYVSNFAAEWVYRRYGNMSRFVLIQSCATENRIYDIKTITGTTGDLYEHPTHVALWEWHMRLKDLGPIPTRYQLIAG